MCRRLNGTPVGFRNTLTNSFRWMMILLFTAGIAKSAEEIRLVDLRGQWKFEIGDNLNWADPNFNDDRWASIFVPASWEDEGFPGYNGYAWYRKRFNLHHEPDSHPLYLYMGRIDDVDEVYLNGHLLGFSGHFPPDYQTAFNETRIYRVPPEYVNFSGENLVAVRIYDEHLAGGILEGRIGLYEIRDPLAPEVPLSGTWKFMTGDNPGWKETTFDDRDWHDLYVPARWDVQGFRDYDGFAWYRKKFYLPRELKEQRLILLLGLIDDLDETYLNGKRIGRTGDIGGRPPNIEGNEWQQFRAYTIPPGLLSINEENLLAVRVYDGLFDGGIYEGPVGIISRDRYLEWRNSRKKQLTFWEYLEAFFK